MASGEQRVTRILDTLRSGDERAGDELLPPVYDELRALEASDPRAHQVVMLHFFAGLTMEQTALAIGVSERTAAREWRFARARLKKELDGGSMPDADAGEDGEP